MSNLVDCPRNCGQKHVAGSQAYKRCAQGAGGTDKAAGQGTSIDPRGDFTEGSPAFSKAQQDRQDEIIENGTAMSAYLFARDTPGADVDALQQKVIDSGDADAMAWFAAEVPGADTEELQERVIESGDPGAALIMARMVPNPDTEALQEVIVEHGEPDTVVAFAQVSPGADIPRLHEVVLERGTILDNYQFAREVPGADTARFQREMIAISERNPHSGMNISSCAYSYARYGDDLDVPALEKALLHGTDAGYMLMFARDVRGADVKTIGYRVAEVGSVREMRDYAEQFPFESKDLLDALERGIKRRRWSL